MTDVARFFHDNLLEWKRKKDPILSRVSYRLVSLLRSAYFCRISWMSSMRFNFLAPITLATYMFFVLVVTKVGAVLIGVCLTFDYGDGRIDCSVGRGYYGNGGGFISRYVCMGLIYYCMGFNTYHKGEVLFFSGSPWVVLIGILAGCRNSFMPLTLAVWNVSLSRRVNLPGWTCLSPSRRRGHWFTNRYFLIGEGVPTV